MKERLLLLFLFFQLLFSSLSAQQIQLLTGGNKISLRGLSVVNDKIIWVSGSSGTVGKSIDSGKTWQWIIVKDFEKRDFRDIEAFDDRTAIIMAIAEPANILKTTDGGTSWNVVFTDTTKGMFLDAMDFADTNNGIVVGDPINDAFFVATTNDGGNHWTTNAHKPIKANLGEAFFASSGTNVLYNRDGSFELVSGGKYSRFITPYQTQKIQMIQGKETTGANSIAIKGTNGIVVGGDFSNAKDTTQNCLFSTDNLHSWIRPTTPPHGYRSCVAFITDSVAICCGTSGVDISNDRGMNWQLVSPESFHVCQKAKNGKSVFLAGANGRIARISW